MTTKPDFVIVDNNLLSQLYSVDGVKAWDTLFNAGKKLLFTGHVLDEIGEAHYSDDFDDWRRDNINKFEIKDYTVEELKLQYGEANINQDTPGKHLGDYSIKYLVDSSDLEGQSYILASSDKGLINSFFDPNQSYAHPDYPPYIAVTDYLSKEFLSGNISPDDYNNYIDKILNSPEILGSIPGEKIRIDPNLPKVNPRELYFTSEEADAIEAKLLAGETIPDDIGAIKAGLKALVGAVGGAVTAVDIAINTAEAAELILDEKYVEAEQLLGGVFGSSTLGTAGYIGGAAIATTVVEVVAGVSVAAIATAGFIPAATVATLVIGTGIIVGYAGSEIGESLGEYLTDHLQDSYSDGDSLFVEDLATLFEDFKDENNIPQLPPETSNPFDIGPEDDAPLVDNSTELFIGGGNSTSNNGDVPLDNNSTQLQIGGSGSTPDTPTYQDPGPEPDIPTYQDPGSEPDIPTYQDPGPEPDIPTYQDPGPEPDISTDDNPDNPGDNSSSNEQENNPLINVDPGSDVQPPEDNSIDPGPWDENTETDSTHENTEPNSNPNEGGASDNSESTSSIEGTDTNGDGVLDSFTDGSDPTSGIEGTDTNGDGVLDSFTDGSDPTSGIEGTDTNGDGVADSFTDGSDPTSSIEGTDTNGDGVADSFTDGTDGGSADSNTGGGSSADGSGSGADGGGADGGGTGGGGTGGGGTGGGGTGGGGTGGGGTGGGGTGGGGTGGGGADGGGADGGGTGGGGTGGGGTGGGGTGTGGTGTGGTGTGGTGTGGTGTGGTGTTGGGGGGAGGSAGTGSGGSGRIIPRDPLVLDLDADGIELTNLEGSNAYFDLNGDGFATQTSWLSGDDGFLVLDRNTDGTINDITELFGSPESTGYEELSELDSNVDGIIDSNDEDFADLKIWKDQNGDGVSQSDELRSLVESGIASVSLDYIDVDAQQDSDGQIARQGTFTWADGTQGVAAETSGIAADVLFSSNPTFTQYVGSVDIDPSTLAVGNIKGYGQMPDLHIAMSVDNSLKDFMLSLFESPTVASLLDNFEQLLTHWAGVSGVTIDEIDPNHRLDVNTETGRVDFRLAGESFTLEQLGIIKQYAGMDALLLGDGQWRENGEIVSTGGYYRQAYNELSSNLLVKFAVANGLLSDVMPGLSYNANTDLLTTTININLEVFDEALANIAQSLNDSESLTKQWLALTALVEIDPSSSDLLADAIGSLLSSYDSTDLDVLLPAFENPVFELLDISSNIGTSGTDNIVGNDSKDVIAGFSGNDTLKGAGGGDIIRAGLGNDYAYGQDGDDLVQGNAGNDRLYGNEGNDRLEGGDGRDYLYGGNGDDTLQGGIGTNDYLSGDQGSDAYLFALGDGNTTINDYYRNDSGTDTLRFLEGIGPDDVAVTRSGNNLVLTLSASGEKVTISNHFNSDDYSLEQVIFADGSTWDEDGLKELVLIPTEEADQITGYASADNLNGLGGNDNLKGAAGNDTLNGGSGNDYVYGQDGDDAVLGDNGNDRLYGNEGNDRLEGGDGRDYLYGGNGDDTLQGGIGTNDYLSGDQGSDAYLFALGDGNTTINDYYRNDSGTDTLRFLDGIGPDDVAVTRSGNNLVLTLSASGEKVTISNHFNSDDYSLEQVMFADGSTWDEDTLSTLVLGATEGADQITGYTGDDTINSLGGNDNLKGAAGNDTLNGGSGNDYVYGQDGDDAVLGDNGNDRLYGNEGNDRLEGGDGRDYLYGGNGNDTLQGGIGTNDYLSGDQGSDAYLFALGDGNTTINDYYRNDSGTDTLKFLEGISSENLWFSRSYNDLKISLIADDSNDELLIKNWYSNEDYQIERIETQSSVILNTEVDRLVELMSQYSDPEEMDIATLGNTIESIYASHDDLWGII